MIPQLCSRDRVAVFRVGIVAIALLIVIVVRERAIATTVLVRAYGIACHKQMPMIKAFGRYVLDDDGAAALAEGNISGLGRLPNIDVGKFDFVRGKTPGQAAYLESANGVSPFGDAPAFGVIGSALMCEDVPATDSNPGYFSPRVTSAPIQPASFRVRSWMIGSAPQIVENEHDHGAVNFTYYQTTRALGESVITRLIPQTGIQTGGGPGFSYAINPYTRFYTTVYLQNQRPALSILMRFKPPLGSHVK